MAEAKVRGITLYYEVIGNSGPWIALTPGSRRASDELLPLSGMLARHGYRVLLHDRRNCGRSDVCIEARGSEHEVWADDLHDLCCELGAVPIYAGGLGNVAGDQLLPAAEGIEDAVLTLERQRAAAAPALSGTVRVAAGECAAGFLARCPAGSTKMALPSGITLELVDELRQTANLVRRQADMALRHEPPESGDFYISKAGTFACAVYRRRGVAAGAWSPSPRSKPTMPPRAGSSGR